MRAPLALSLLALVLTGCAKYPKDATSDYTRLTFTYRMAAPINPNYLYIIAIRPRTAAEYSVDDGDGPVPVVTIGSGGNNGFVAGRPTRYVYYNPASPTFYQVNRFGARTPTTEDPSPIDLNAISTEGYALTGTNPAQADGSYSDTLSFTITTQDLADSPADARLIAGLEFNILTMNKQATTSADIGDRVMDALGDQTNITNSSFNDYRRVRVDISGRFTSGMSTDVEQQYDVYGRTQLPAVDLVDWSLDVNPQ